MPGENVYGEKFWSVLDGSYLTAPLTGGSTSYFGPALLSAVNAGTVPLSRLNDMATRILASWLVSLPILSKNSTDNVSRQVLVGSRLRLSSGKFQQLDWSRIACQRSRNPWYFNSTNWSREHSPPKEHECHFAPGKTLNYRCNW